MRTEGPWSLNDVQYYKNKDQWATYVEIGDFVHGGYYAGKISYNGTTWMLILAPIVGGVSHGLSLQTEVSNFSTSNS